MKNKTFQIITGAILLTLVIALVLVPDGNAQGIIYGESIPAGRTVEQNVVLAGDNVTIDGTVVGDVVAFGTNITINGDIQGSLVTAGQNIRINGAVDGSIYSAALTMTLQEAANLQRDLYYIGAQLVMQPGSSIGRDLYAITLGATLSGKVARDMRAIIGPIEILNAILNATQGKTLNDILPSRSGSSLSGNPTSESQYRLSFASLRHPQYSANSASLELISVQSRLPTELLEFTQVNPAASGIDTQQLTNWLLARLRALVTYLVIGGLSLLIFRKWFESWANRVRKSPLAAAAWGLVILVFGFSATFLVALMILPIAIFLFSLTLSNLAVYLLSLGYFTLGLAFTIFSLFVFYISKVIVAYLIGKWILEKLAPRTLQYSFLPLLLGVFIYVLLISIPAVGWVIGTIASLLGLGAIWMVFRDRSNSEDGVPTTVEPAAIP